MTLEQYVLNPMGKSGAVLSAMVRETQRKLYKSKFDSILMRENGMINYRLYKDSTNNRYWVHIKVPSESVRKFYYDVVFKFYADATKGTSNDLFKWFVQFYSNDPAFVFTYAYVFNDKGLLIPELRSKMSKTAIKTAAKEKNPDNLVGYVKIIYFGYLLMEMKKLNQIKRFENEAIGLAPKLLLDDIDDAEQKIEDRQAQKVSRRKKPIVDEKTYRRLKREIGINADATVNVRTDKRVHTITNSHKIEKIKPIKKMKKIGRK